MRLAAAVKLDTRVQARNQLWGISIGVAVLAAGALAWLSPPERIGGTVPMTLLMFAGGSTLLYVTAMILLERGDGTLAAISVSPLRPWEYLASKVATLTALATAEALIITYGAIAIVSRQGPVVWPGPWLLVGVLALGAMHVLIGVVIVVRYDKINEVLLPMSMVASVLQIPALWMIGALEHPLWLAIPSAAPTMLIRAAFVPLSTGEWIYALGYTTVATAGLAVWARRAFSRHVTRRGG